MVLHLIKLAVGVDSIDSLQHAQLRRIKQYKKIGLRRPELCHITRNTPRRMDELLIDGSLYWVLKKYILVRQKIIRFEKIKNKDDKESCAIFLDTNMQKTIPKKQEV